MDTIAKLGEGRNIGLDFAGAETTRFSKDRFESGKLPLIDEKGKIMYYYSQD